MVHPPRPWLLSTPHQHHSPTRSDPPLQHSSQSKFQKLITDRPPIEEVQNIHCAARSFSSLLLNAAKASIPLGRLGCPPKVWWCKEAELAVRDRQRARSELHRSEVHRLAYVEASRRAYSVISRAKSETWQTTCNNLSPHSTPRAVFNFSILLLVKRVPSATRIS